MSNSSPQTLLISGMALAGMSFKLKSSYPYFYYIGITLGLIIFIFGIIKHFYERNRFK